MRRRTCPFLVTAVALVACGGGGGGSGEPVPRPEPGATSVGQFKDANVEGLAYRTASQSGITDAAGRFRYRPGEDVQFGVGGIDLGSAPAAPVVTPLDLATDGRTDAAAVLNRVRLLMMLDRDGDARNGIAISAAVRAAAAGWASPDFAAAGFDAAVAGVVAAVAAADGRTAALPDAATARAHLEATMHCATSGAYTGRFEGARSGGILILQRPDDGRVVARLDSSSELLTGPLHPPVERSRAFRLERASDGATINGRFVDGQASGSWQIGAETGTFSASTLWRSPEAVYRFTGSWQYQDRGPDNRQFTTFEVDAAGGLLAAFGNFGGSFNSGTGALDGTTLTWASTTAAAGSGQLDLQTLRLTGSWTGQSNAGSFEAVGCRLN